MVRHSVAPLILTALMVLMSWGALIDAVQEAENESSVIALETEDVVYGASDPGHVVFSQYITSDNCGFCYQYGSPAHHKLKNDFPDRFVYISYQSLSYGDTDTTRAGNTANYNWPWTTGGAPDSYWGDRLDERASGCGSNTCYDTIFSSGGGMTAATTSQYSMGAGVSGSGSNLAITITSQFVGTGTAPSNVYLYAALTEETCHSYTYSDGSKGHNCWKAWLTSGNSYKSQSGGSGSAFEAVSLAGGNQVSYTWSVPASLVSGGASNAMVVAALMTGAPSTGASNEHTLSAIDSSMNPMDLSLTDFTYSNLDAQTTGFLSGDTLKFDATVGNTGTEDYSSGGQIQIYQVSSSGSESPIGSAVQLNSLNVGQTQSISEQFDTSSIQMDQNDPQTVFRAKLTGTQGEKDPVGNNVRVVYAAHDMVPSTSKPIANGNTAIDRGETLDFEVTGLPNDNVDDLGSMTAEIQTSANGANQWSSDWFTGGALMGVGTGNERYVFTVTPPNSAGSGDYDVRARMTDARGQVGDWSPINSNAFALMNGLPMVVTSDNIDEAPGNCPAYPGQPTVKVETIERIDVSGIICDAETPLDQLVISSSNPAFRAWDAAAGEIEVKFDVVQTNLQNEVVTQPIQFTINDGEDTNTGTLHIMVIENGAPRWASLPTQSFNEGDGSSVVLTSYLTDTDNEGDFASPNDLILTVQYISNSSLMTAGFTGPNGHRLNIDGANDDAFGTGMVVVRATDSDGQYADTEVTVIVANVNDAPTLDVSTFDNLKIKVSDEFNFDVLANMYDVDDPVEPLYVSVSCDTWKTGSRYNPLDGAIKAWFEEEGIHTISIVVSDVHDDLNAYYVTVEVIDSLPLVWSENAQSGDLMAHADNLYINENPTFNVTHHSGLGLTDVAIEWAICNKDSGICTDFGTEDAGNLDSVYTFTLSKSQGEMLFHDQVKLTVTAIDSDGFDRETSVAAEFDVTEERPSEVVDDSTDDTTTTDDSTSTASAIPSLAVIGVVGTLIVLLIIALTLGVMMLRGGGKNDDLGMGYGAAPPPQLGTPSMPMGMVPDYSQLPAGGNYVTNDAGQTVYLSPDNTDWTMQPDNSFIRTR
ncbi:MAG: hypothetical protein QF807_07935 [Candidatus Thalassarchaeaceae archaeon]|nr:hypothetical protein [Candidatus Thalassarchaeaceae archaeon]